MNSQAQAIIDADIARILEHPLPWQVFNGSTVLISGASGFLAAYMVETLAALNARGASIRLIGLVRNLEKARQRLGHLSVHGVELLSQDIAAPLRSDLARADFIIHSASQASPKYYGIDPVGTIEANTTGTQQLLRHAQASGSQAFLFFSSSEIYGRPTEPDEPLSESDCGYLDPATLRACYAESKRMGETLCVCWHHQYGVPARMVRPFHSYGPGMDLKDGRVFADFVADVVARRDITLKSDGLAMRPFCYISDATAGFFTVLLKGESGQAYNVANPAAEISMRDLAQTLVGLFPERSLGLRFEIPQTGNGYLQSAVNRTCPSIARIEQLGWKPQIGIADGFWRTIQSYL